MKKPDFSLLRHPEVKYDLKEIIDYYNDQQANLGNEFYKKAKRRMLSLKTDALLYTVRYANVRCAKIPSFPYLIHYSIDEVSRTVFIEAIIQKEIPKPIGAKEPPD